MKRNKLVSIIESSVKGKVLVGVLAASLIGASGMMLASGGNLSNNNFSVNKIMLAGTLNNKGNKACVINGDDNLVLYATANHSNIQSYVSVGEMLTINSYDNGYYNVTVQETGATGYISSSDMQKIVSGVGDSLTSLSGTAYTTNVSTMVNLREEATMNSTSLAMLKNNTSVSLLAKQGNWYKVDVNGTIGYIYGEYIALTNTNSSAINNTSLSSNNKSKIIGTVSSNSKNSSIKVTSSHSNVNKKTTSNKNKPIVKNIQSNSTVGYVYEPVGDGLVGVYQGASDQTALETTLKSGTKVTVLGETNNCYKIEYGNNEIGYLGKQFISFNKPTVKNTQSNSTPNTKTINNPSTKTTSSSSNSQSINQLKQMYLSKLGEVQQEINGSPKPETDAQLLSTANLEIKCWDTMLGNILNSLEGVLTQNQIFQLRSNEYKWLDNMESTVNQIKNAGGSSSAALAASKEATLTKARCYYLVNTYI